MAAQGRRQTPDLGERHGLIAAPHRFGFFQAVRLLELMAPRRRPVGHDAAPRDEAVRFMARPHLGFAPCEVHDLEMPDPAALDGGRGPAVPVLTVNFLGLTGPSGVLPTSYSEMVIEEGPGGPLAAFLNLFDHRLISLFFRAWERNHPALSADAEARDRFSGYLLALAGLDLGATRGPHPPGAESLLPHAGLFAQRRRTAAGLVQIVGDHLNDGAGRLADERWSFPPGARSLDAVLVVAYLAWVAHADRAAGDEERGGRWYWHAAFVSLHALLHAADGRFAPEEWRIAVEILPFIGRWLAIDPGQVMRLRHSATGPGLGRGAVVGSRARDHQGKFRLRIGPLTAGQFRVLQPEAQATGGGETSAFASLVRLIRQYVGPEFEFDVELVLLAREVERCRPGPPEFAPRLGRAWITSRPASGDRSVIARPKRHRAAGPVLSARP